MSARLSLLLPAIVGAHEPGERGRELRMSGRTRCPDRLVARAQELFRFFALALTRQALGADLPELYYRCNPAARLRRSISRNPTGWFTAIAIAGVIGSKWYLASRKNPGAKPKKEKRSLAGLLPLLGFLYKSAWKIAKPEAEKLLRSQLSGLAGLDARPPQPKDSA